MLNFFLIRERTQKRGFFSVFYLQQIHRVEASKARDYSFCLSSKFMAFSSSCWDGFLCNKNARETLNFSSKHIFLHCFCNKNCVCVCEMFSSKSLFCFSYMLDHQICFVTFFFSSKWAETEIVLVSLRIFLSSFHRKNCARVTKTCSNCAVVGFS